MEPVNDSNPREQRDQNDERGLEDLRELTSDELVLRAVATVCTVRLVGISIFEDAFGSHRRSKASCVTWRDYLDVLKPELDGLAPDEAKVRFDELFDGLYPGVDPARKVAEAPRAEEDLQVARRIADALGINHEGLHKEDSVAEPDNARASLLGMVLRDLNLEQLKEMESALAGLPKGEAVKYFDNLYRAMTGEDSELLELY